MALTFDYKKIIDREGEDFVLTAPSNLGVRHYTAQFDTLVWVTMLIGGEEITEDNLDSKLFRITALKLGDTAWDDLPSTKAELRRYIGLRTNAGRVTDAHFNKTLLRIITERAQRAIRRTEVQLAESA